MNKNDPNSINIDDIVTKKNQLDVGRYIVRNREKILRGMNETERETYCKDLAESVLNVMNNEIDEGVQRRNYHALLDISRSGINAFFSSKKDNNEPLSKYEERTIDIYTYL